MRPARSPRAAVTAAARWYFRGGQASGAGRALPFYCDATYIGNFAVAPDQLAAGGDTATFRLFITLSMYQALKDVVIMRQQRALPRVAMRIIADVGTVGHAVATHACPAMRSAEAFANGCDVSKRAGRVDCASSPGVPCHVKDATVAFNRMGDMGRLPTSAWLLLWKNGGVRRMLAEVCRQESSPAIRAVLLVERFAKVHRVGRKLATMFVSALSTPALAPGLTPWFPAVDGNELVVVDTNLARAVDTLCDPGASRTYDARELWIREQAATLDLAEIRPDLPRYSPRLLQQALYAFCSRSNRVAAGDSCARRSTPCAACAPVLCPFAQRLSSCSNRRPDR